MISFSHKSAEHTTKNSRKEVYSRGLIEDRHLILTTANSQISADTVVWMLG